MSSLLDEMKVNTRIRPSSAHSFQLKAGDQLLVIDPQGQQVADLVAFSTADIHECMSSGRSIDYASKIWLSTGDILYSNRSKPMFTILEDTCGRHDFMLATCSNDTLSIGLGETESRLGCLENLAKVLEKYGIGIDRIPTAFNVFMHVALNMETGAISVLQPLSKPGDFVRLRAEIDLVVGLCACCAAQSNNFSYKPIDFRIEQASNFSPMISAEV